tara:strand:+ start:144 stop:752 length:609 start_codon:yes stop_codon:yes gene_type:complete
MSQIKLKHSGGNSVIIAAPDSNPASDRTLKLPSDGDGTILTTNSSVGKILQVKQAVKSDRQTIQSTTLVDITGMSVSITPSSTSNKILVDYSLVVFANAQYYTMRLLRGSDSTIFIGDQNANATSQSRGAFGTYQASYVNAMTVAQKFLDSPNTTSATTYKLQAHCPYDSSYIIGINSAVNQDNYTYMTNCVSSITVMEVAG